MTHSHRIVPFRAEHLTGVPWREEKALMYMRPGHLALYEAGPAWTGLCDGQFIASAGLMIAYPGLAEAWAVAGPLTRSHVVYFHRTVKRVILELAQALRLRRVQCSVQADFQTGRDWVEVLGFRPESTMLKYGPEGETFMQYVWFPEVS